ncbi:MAG: hypothetical protein JST75_09530 [Bacteroidetes bacterium]|nr:hypothetical protein [Bacteroidota bacterium]
MSQENYEYLSRQLRIAGFPETVNHDLQNKMNENAPAFVLTFSQKKHNEESNATLFFKKSDDSEKYFFNSYHLNMKTDSNASGIGQTFYVDNKRKIEGQENYKRVVPLDEAINMLAKADNKEEQRFVYGTWVKKNGEVYSAWKGININEKDRNGNHEYLSFHDNYGFDLKKSLQNLPISETQKNDPDLIKSLQKGNLVSISSENGKEFYLSANPKDRKVNIFDKEMKLTQTMNDSPALSLPVNGSSVKNEHNILDSNKISPENSMVQTNVVMGKKETRIVAKQTHDSDDVNSKQKPRKRAR